MFFFCVLLLCLVVYLFSCRLYQVRCTAGFSCTQRLGPGVENMPGELEVANITPHHTIVCRLEHDGRKLEEGGMVYVQVSNFSTRTGHSRVGPALSPAVLHIHQLLVACPLVHADWHVGREGGQGCSVDYRQLL